LFVELGQPSPVNGIGLGHLLGALDGLSADGMDQADLHVQRDALLLQGMEIGQHGLWSLGVLTQLFPQLDPHSPGAHLLPTQENWASRSVLVRQPDRQQGEGIALGLGQDALLGQDVQVGGKGTALLGQMV